MDGRVLKIEKLVSAQDAYVIPALWPVAARIWAERAANDRGVHLWAYSDLTSHPTERHPYSLRICTHTTPPHTEPYRIMPGDRTHLTFAVPVVPAWMLG